jgi:hypothetical protein
VIIYTIACLGLAACAICIAAISLQSEGQWKRCPMCRQFHRGNVITPTLPPEADGSVHLEICKGCMDAAAFFERRETEIRKEFSR